MKLDVISLNDLNAINNLKAVKNLNVALLEKGIVGISYVPEFENKCMAYIKSARNFSKLNPSTKKQYSPDRDSGNTEGYELAAEKFQSKDGVWQVDDKKASYYAFVPDNIKNIWPLEVDLKTSYLELGELIFNTGKIILNILGLNHNIGLDHDKLVGYGRMLHYQKENIAINENPNWCGAHLDHGVFTGLIPSYYFHEDVEINEPDEAGLYIVPSDGNQFEKINASRKDILLFQVGEFGQLISNDRIKATKHMVRKAQNQIERFTFALFYGADDNTMVKSSSSLIHDDRYKLNQSADGSIRYDEWQKASFARYRATE